MSAEPGLKARPCGQDSRSPPTPLLWDLSRAGNRSNVCASTAGSACAATPPVPHRGPGSGLTFAPDPMNGTLPASEEEWYWTVVACPCLPCCDITLTPHPFLVGGLSTWRPPGRAILSSAGGVRARPNHPSIHPSASFLTPLQTDFQRDIKKKS